MIAAVALSMALAAPGRAPLRAAIGGNVDMQVMARDLHLDLTSWTMHFAPIIPLGQAGVVFGGPGSRPQTLAGALEAAYLGDPRYMPELSEKLALKLVPWSLPVQSTCNAIPGSRTTGSRLALASVSGSDAQEVCAQSRLAFVVQTVERSVDTFGLTRPGKSTDSSSSYQMDAGIFDCAGRSFIAEKSENVTVDGPGVATVPEQAQKAVAGDIFAVISEQFRKYRLRQAFPVLEP